MDASSKPPELWRRRCTMCGGYLAADRPLGSNRCSCCGGDTEYNPRHDKHLDERVLSILVNGAHSGYVNVARMLGTEDRMAVWCAIKRLRRQGWDIRGSRGHGYVLG